MAAQGEAQLTLIARPYCTETKPKELVESYLTPNEAHYTRNHAPVPVFAEEDVAEHEIEFTRGDEEVLSCTLGGLNAVFGEVTVNSIVQCAGNRAADNIHVNEGSGFVGSPFEVIRGGMVGNARWSGPRLADVLRELYPELARFAAAATPLPPPLRPHPAPHSPDADLSGLHVRFEGADGYYSSTPLALVMGRECILATRMNGAPIPPDHGYPVRVLLPGIAGARCVKWVQKVSVVKEECDSPWNAVYYKAGEPDTKHSAQQLPLQSIILSHEPGEVPPFPRAAAAAACCPHPRPAVPAGAWAAPASRRRGVQRRERPEGHAGRSFGRRRHRLVRRDAAVGRGARRRRRGPLRLGAMDDRRRRPGIARGDPRPRLGRRSEPAARGWAAQRRLPLQRLAPHRVGGINK